MSICGSGMETYLRPCRPIISPCDMYLRRSFLILPRTIWRKRLRSRSTRRMDIHLPYCRLQIVDCRLGWPNLQSTICNLKSILGVAACEDAGHVVQHIGRALLVVAEVADQACLNHVDLLLSVLVDHPRDQRSQLDRVLLILEQLQLERLVQALV